VREQYADPASRYRCVQVVSVLCLHANGVIVSVGRMGRYSGDYCPSFFPHFTQEIMNGKPDTLKGSYYANPVEKSGSEVSPALREAYPEYYNKNICTFF
jgi:hypothetical protein